MQSTRHAARHRRGFTLIEIIIALAVAAIVLATAAPAFGALIEKKRLDGAASRLVADVQFARAEAARRHESVFLSLHGTQSGCYLLHTGALADCNCTDDGSEICNGGAQALKTVGLGLTALRLATPGKSTYIAFDPVHGTSSPTNTLILTASSGRSIRVVVSLMGRVRTCSPNTSAPAVPGYAIC